GGKLDSPVPQRIFWAVMEGVVAAVLLIGGGLSALQTASIATGLPFAIVLLLMIYSLGKGFGEELYHLAVEEVKEIVRRTEQEERGVPALVPGAAAMPAADD
ncbi:MAG: BCCT family transporter, partial [Caldilineaceae bacterium]|nr:BCCT family transporter [Caldilineaceae bacterium]